MVFCSCRFLREYEKNRREKNLLSERNLSSRASFSKQFLIAALIFSAGYYSAPIFFLQFKEFELYWGAVLSFFKILRSVHTFS